MIANRRSWPGAGRRSFSRSIWGEMLTRRPCESRDPYAAAVVIKQSGRRLRQTTTPCCYGSLRRDDSYCRSLTLRADMLGKAPDQQRNVETLPLNRFGHNIVKDRH